MYVIVVFLRGGAGVWGGQMSGDGTMLAESHVAGATCDDNRRVKIGSLSRRCDAASHLLAHPSRRPARSRHSHVQHSAGPTAAQPRLKSWRGPRVGWMPITFLVFLRSFPVSPCCSTHVSLIPFPTLLSVSP